MARDSSKMRIIAVSNCRSALLTEPAGLEPA
jgi:hypothetical protein